MKQLILIILFFSGSEFADAQIIYTAADSLQFISLANQLKTNPIVRHSTGEFAVEAAKLLLDRPYKGGTLDITKEEELIINLSEFDCVTLVENSIALAELVKMEKYGFADFCNALQQIRYRDGIIDQYPSRLHYFEDWIINNAEKGIIRDITKDIGGISYTKKVSYMSSHAQEYDKLAANPSFVTEIKQTENRINQHSFYYIPKDKLSLVKSHIQTGDIIAFTIALDGMDIGHTGFAYWKDGDLYLLHASSDFKEVMITNKPLQDYLLGNKSQTGIMVLRLQSNL